MDRAMSCGRKSVNDDDGDDDKKLYMHKKVTSAIVFCCMIQNHVALKRARFANFQIFYKIS